MNPKDKSSVLAEIARTMNERKLDGLARVLHPEFEFHSLLARVAGGAYEGLDGTREYLGELDTTWERFHFELEDVRDAGERVAVIWHVTGAARASGVPLDRRVGHVWTWRDGKPWRSVAYADPADPLKAVGPPEP